MTTIDLHLPTSWNGCTTADLEAIAAAIIQEQQRTDRYHPFDWSRVKLNVVLAINSLTPVPSPKGEGSSQTSALSHQTSDIAAGRNAAGRVVASSAGDIGASGDEYLVRRPQDRAPWPITTGQLVALTDRLAFLDDPKANRTIYAFPYPELLIHQPSSIIHLLGPAPLLDGYTWQEYRYLTDWMQEYMRRTNARQDATEPMAQFLAVLFKPAGTVPASSAGDNPATSAISPLTSDIFEGFSPIKWQVILFWWSSLMGLLQQKFPASFKPQPVGRGRGQKKNETPWDFYNRVTATIQKYIGGLSEHDVNAATYGTILQQLDMMAQEAAELERVKARHS